MANEAKPRSDLGKAWRIILLLLVAAFPVQMMYMGITQGGASVFFYIIFASALTLVGGRVARLDMARVARPKE